VRTEIDMLSEIGYNCAVEEKDGRRAGGLLLRWL